MTRTVYLVTTVDGFLGSRRYSYARGKSEANYGRDFGHARIFARKSDAVQALNLDKKALAVVEAIITLKEPA